MPSSQAAATAAAERHNDRAPIPPEPPKLKTTLKTPPKQATNPLQFVKVGPCSLYRTAQEQLQKVQEVKKIKQEIRDDPEDWQSNLDNWKSSRRKRQEHIIERVVEVKKLELEEHDRQRRRSKTFSEMMEERGNRGRKLSISLAVYNEEDANDLSDLGIGTSSGKSSVSGDTHDDTHSVLSDRDSEIDKNHSDVDNAGQENGPDNSDTGASSRQNSPLSVAASATSTSATTSTSAASSAPNPPVGTSSSTPPLPPKKEVLNNGFHKATPSLGLAQQQQEYDSGTTATVSSPEPEEYTYEGAIRGYVSRVSQNIPRRSLVDLDAKLPKSPQEEKSQQQPGSPVVKVDILKRREIFEKATRPEAAEAPKNGQLASSRQPEQQPAGGKSIKERLSILERQKAESEALDKSSKSPRHEAGPPQPIHRFVKPLSLPAEGKEPIKTRDLIAEELEAVKPLRERLSHLEKLAAGEQRANLEAATAPLQHNGDSLSPKSIKDRLVSLEPARALGAKGHQEKRPSGCFHEQTSSRAENNSTPSERSSSPDSEYRAPRATFHQSLDSLDADASSGPDTFERVQSLEELDYHQSRRYPASSSSAEILNDTDREDSGIHTADASCSVSQADEPIEEELGGPAAQQAALPDKAPLAALVLEEKTEFRGCVESTLAETSKSLERVEEKMSAMTIEPEQQSQRPAVPTDKVKPENQQQHAPAEQVEESPLEEEPLAEEPELQKPQEEELEEEEEALEAVAGKKEEEQPEKRNDEQSALAGVMESPILVQEALANLQLRGPKKEDQLLAPAMLLLHDNKLEQPPVRPTTLALEKTTLCPNFLSPMSPASKQILPLSFSSDEEIVSNLSFPLGPPTSVEPPKEKPPPPPVDLSDEENHPIEPLKRLNSTRRIKKEMRSRRSDFLGIEGFNDEEFERELSLSKPPDMAAILAEERRIEQLHRRSYDTDSNYEQDSSHERDSGVELGQAEDWSKQPVSPDMSQHSRQSSEPFGASVTSSEEDEISKKEREIIEVLEREEQWRYENNREINSDIGEKLAHKLRELEEEKMQLERERASQDSGSAEAQPQQPQQSQQPQAQQQQRRQRHQEPTAETLRMNEENLRKQEELARKQSEIAARQQQEQLAEEKRQQLEKEARLQEQQIRGLEKRDDRDRRSIETRRPDNLQIAEKKTLENKPMSSACSEEEYASRQDVLRVERELLQLEQEELKRQRTNLAFREQKQQSQYQDQWKSLQNVAQPVQQQQPQLRQSQQYSKPLPSSGPLNYRASMPNLQLQEASLGQRRRPPPPPIPPAKPLRLVEQRQRMLPIGNSRIPSADSIPQQVEAPLRPSCSATALASGHHGQQMSRQTLQALSAVPRPRIVQGDQWVQRRKSDVPRGAHDYNYQHWLIQEAEQRRISEKNSQRSPARKPHVTGTSVPYTSSPPRTDSKPLPDSIIQTLTQRVQNRAQEKPLSPRRRLEHSTSQEHLHSSQHYQLQQHKIHQSPNNNNSNNNNNSETQEKMLSVSGKKKCSHCGDELGRGAAMIIESLRLFYHMECFKCCVCHVRLGDGLMGTDVRVRNHKLHCHNCYSSDDGVKFSCV